MQTCPACDHQFRVSDRQTLAMEEENERLRRRIGELEPYQLEARSWREWYQDGAKASEVNEIFMRVILETETRYPGAASSLGFSPVGNPVDNSDPPCG